MVTAGWRVEVRGTIVRESLGRISDVLDHLRQESYSGTVLVELVRSRNESWRMATTFGLIKLRKQALAYVGLNHNREICMGTYSCKPAGEVPQNSLVETE